LTLGRGEHAHVISLPPELYVANMEVEDVASAPTDLMASSSQIVRNHRLLQASDSPTGGTASAGLLTTMNASLAASVDPFHNFRQRLNAQLATLVSQPSDATGPTFTPASVATDGAPTMAPFESADRGSHAATSSSRSATVAPKEACVALFMDMELTSSQPGRPWILGLPLMRAYKARFDRKARTVGLAKLPLGTNHCTSCQHNSIRPPKVVADFFPTVPGVPQHNTVAARRTMQLSLLPTQSLQQLQMQTQTRTRHTMMTLATWRPSPPREQLRQPPPRRSAHATLSPHLRMSLGSLNLPSWVRRRSLVV